jgi:hypothetical protein
MTDRELMQQALDALEYLPEMSGIEEAIQALRDRLAQPEPEPAFYVIQATDRFGEGYEQTYWEDPNGFPVYTAPVHAIDTSQERVDETAKRKHEPVAWHEPGAYGNVTTHKDWALANGWEPLYAAPPKREWVGLTDEEIEEHFFDNVNTGCLLSFGAGAAYAEAKLKEKNNG